MELTSLFCARPKNFAWFLGAGASRTAGLPTANDVIWYMKRRFYCQEENQDISRQDIQNKAVKARIQDFMASKGFPELWSENEYTTYFEKIFGDNSERQRKFLKSILSEDNVTLSVGNRVFGAMLAEGYCRVAFTTNFDSVVEKAVAEVSGQSLSAYHIEGSHVAIKALDNEEYPIYCKLHGDFRYDSLKNLPVDLATQNAALSKCLENAGNRFGFIVAGYSGRDESVMDLFYTVLESNNPFPHGLFWTGIKGSVIPPAVESLLAKAQEKGVNAQYIPIETFDSLLLRLWRNIDDKSVEMNAQVMKSQIASVCIPLPSTGIGKPILRLNALPVTVMPKQCLELTFDKFKDWSDIRQARIDSDNNLILTKSDSVWCWGSREKINEVFGKDISAIRTRELPIEFSSSGNLHIKSFVEEALCAALVQRKPLLARNSRYSSFLIADPHADDKSGLDPLYEVVGKESGEIVGLFTPVTDEFPHAQKVAWSEAVRVSIDQKDGKFWLLLNPDIWIWPPRARKSAVEFMDDRRRDRLNNVYNSLLDAWIQVILDTDERNVEVSVTAFDGEESDENPSFCIGSRTAFSQRSIS